MVGAVDDALEGDGGLSVCDAWYVPDLLHGGVCLGRLVGSQLDHEIESSRYGRAGFDVGNVLYLGNGVCTFSFAFGEYVACLIIFRHFFYRREPLVTRPIFFLAYPRPCAPVTLGTSSPKVSPTRTLDGLQFIELFPQTFLEFIEKNSVVTTISRRYS